MTGKLTPPKKYQEFVAYDQEGHPVVLRSNRSDRSAPGSEPDEAEAPPSSLEGQIRKNSPFKSRGSMGLFGNPRDLSAPLKKK